MLQLTRRQFGGLALAVGAASRRVAAATSIDETLRTGIAQRKIPCVTAMVAGPEKILYSGAFGKRDSASGLAVKPDSIFAIASMTKAVTSAAALQLVERGTLTLDEPVAKHLPQLAKLNVLEGFDSSGKPMLRPATKPVTLRRLLTHTSGFAYDTWDGNMLRYNQQAGSPPPNSAPVVTPLIFEPGTRWQYGTSLDWTGALVEKVSGQTLEQYFQEHILHPLGMNDTSFMVPKEKFERLVSEWRRQPDGTLKEDPRVLPPAPKFFNGGGGLYSTAPDYICFMQMILRKGRGPSGTVLEPKTVDMMSSNQIGPLGAGKLKTFRPAVSADVDFHPGATDKFGFGFLINTTAYEGGRSAGSLAWAGVANTFYWIDPHRQICAAIMMQFLPFVDPQGVGMLHDFEHSVYATLA